MATLDKELQAFLKTEVDRTANTSRVVLSLELSNLKRAIERGDSFAMELTAAKRVAGDSLNLTLLIATPRRDCRRCRSWQASFRKVANGMLDAEAEPADAPLLERLLSGARSIVRVRKSGQAADDGSLRQRSPAWKLRSRRTDWAMSWHKARSCRQRLPWLREDWLRRVEMRYQVEKALADTEAALKSSLAAAPAGTDRRQ